MYSEKTFEYAINVALGNILIEGVPHRFKNEVMELLNNEAALIEYAKDFRWEQIKAVRNSKETAGFEYKGKIFDCDERSVIKINMVISTAKEVGADFSIDWTTQDNSVMTLTYEDIMALPIVLSQHSNELHQKGRIYRELIYSATTIKDIFDVEWED